MCPAASVDNVGLCKLSHFRAVSRHDEQMYYGGACRDGDWKFFEDERRKRRDIVQPHCRPCDLPRKVGEPDRGTASIEDSEATVQDDRLPDTRRCQRLSGTTHRSASKYRIVSANVCGVPVIVKGRLFAGSKLSVGTDQLALHNVRVFSLDP